MDSEKTTGVLLVNLGTPDSPNVRDVKKYLREFLMDPFVIDIPWLFRWLLINLIIAPFRSPKSSHAYLKIWQEEGSPLYINTKNLALKLQVSLGKSFHVRFAMRYGKPSLLSELLALQNVSKIVLLPMYPHYAESSIRTTVEAVNLLIKKNKLKTPVEVFKPFYADSLYVSSLSKSIQDHLKGQRIDHYVFSYHGLPERHILKTDSTKNHCLKTSNCCLQICEANKNCYKHHATQTTLKVIEKLDLNPEDYTISFQSRLGRDQWLTPSTEDTLVALANRGVKRLAIVAPAFLSDCLETLEELNLGLREKFLSSGGESFHYVPCLNDGEFWVESLSRMIENSLKVENT